MIILTCLHEKWQGIVVSKWRKLSGIKYPQSMSFKTCMNATSNISAAYAEVSEMKANKNAQIFNCAQRAHMNMLEHLPSFLAAYAISSHQRMILIMNRLFWTGLRYPRTAGALGWLWIVGKSLDGPRNYDTEMDQPTGRVLYTTGYVTGNPNGVCLQSLLSYISLVTSAIVVLSIILANTVSFYNPSQHCTL